ncbi:MAG: ATP-binding cassette domain-containing protein [Pseudomonadota bacterium]
MIEIHDLHFAWPSAASDTLVLPALRIAPGQRVFLHGPSGCGKSTLLGLMAGVLLPRTGQVRLLGTDWQRLSSGRRDRFRADHVGLIFQQFNLLPYLSAVDNVCLPGAFSTRRRQRAEAAHGSVRHAAHTLLAQMRLPTDLWSRPAVRLSVGQQQRVAAARALLGAPDLLIADEPTSALDASHRDDFMALLMQACPIGGERALVFVSHDERLAGHFDVHWPLGTLNQVAAAQGLPS